MNFKKDMYFDLDVLDENLLIRLTFSDEKHERLKDYGDCDVYMHLTTKEDRINSVVFDQFQVIYDFLEKQKSVGKKKDRPYKIRITTPPPEVIYLYIRKINKKDMSINFLLNLIDRLLDYLDYNLDVNKEDDISENYNKKSLDHNDDIHVYSGQVEHSLNLEQDSEPQEEFIKRPTGEKEDFYDNEFFDQDDEKGNYDTSSSLFDKSTSLFDSPNVYENEKNKNLNKFDDEDNSEKYNEFAQNYYRQERQVENDFEEKQNYKEESEEVNHEDFSEKPQTASDFFEDDDEDEDFFNSNNVKEDDYSEEGFGKKVNEVQFDEDQIQKDLESIQERFDNKTKNEEIINSDKIDIPLDDPDSNPFTSGSNNPFNSSNEEDEEEEDEFWSQSKGK